MSTIKCIKRKCEYCEEHDFFVSYYRCAVTNLSFKKDSEGICYISDTIKEKSNELEDLKDLRMFIRVNQ